MPIEDSDLTDLLMKTYEKSAEAIFFFDRSRKVIAMNNAAKLILEPGVLNQMAEGLNDALCISCSGYTSENELKSCASCFLKNPGADFSSFQVYLNTHGKGVIPYAASFQTIDEENGIRVFMLRNLTKQFRTQETLHQRTIVKKVIKAQEDERKRISRELHDSVAQEILSSLVELRVLKYMNIEREVLEKVQQTEGSLMCLLDDIQHLSVELRPATLDDLGLEAAFRTHFKWIEKNYGLHVLFSAELEEKRYEGEIETVVYRVCQEAIFNAHKYAETDIVVVRLFEEAEHLKLKIQDKGKGFTVDFNTPKGTGLGIYGMRERAQLVGGNFAIQSEVGKGTVAYLNIPLKKITE